GDQNVGAGRPPHALPLWRLHAGARHRPDTEASESADPVRAGGDIGTGVRRPRGGRARIEAASGEEAIALVERCHPDVVVMDLDMPGIGGLAAIRTLTALERHPSILVLT